MRVRSIVAAVAMAAASVPAMAQDASPETAATAQEEPACANAVEAPSPRRRRGLGGLLRAVGQSGALTYVPGLGMAGQVASLVAGTAAAAAPGEGATPIPDACAVSTPPR